MRHVHGSVVSTATLMIAILVTSCGQGAETVSSSVVVGVEPRVESINCERPWMPSVLSPPDFVSLTQSSTVVVLGIVRGYRVEKKRDLDAEADRATGDSVSKRFFPTTESQAFPVSTKVNPNRDDPIYRVETVNNVSVERVLWGSSKLGDSLEVRSLGDGITTCSPMNPIPAKDEPFVMFLGRTEAGEWGFVARYSIGTDGALHHATGSAPGAAKFIDGITVDELAKQLGTVPTK